MPHRSLSPSAIRPASASSVAPLLAAPLLAAPLLASLSLATGCGVSAPIGPGADAATVADAALGPDAHTGLADAAVLTPPVPYYEVPVDDASLLPHAFFEVPDVHYVRSGGTVTLTYDFPADLSGVVDQTVELSGPIDAEGNATLSGTQGTGTCTVSAGIVRCIETFTGLPLAPDAARAQVGGYGADAAARAARLAVVDRFLTDPIGIVVFDLATASEPSGGDDD